MSDIYTYQVEFTSPAVAEVCYTALDHIQHAVVRHSPTEVGLVTCVEAETLATHIAIVGMVACGYTVSARWRNMTADGEYQTVTIGGM